MSRQRATVRIGDILSAAGGSVSGDELERRVLDAAEGLLRTSGLRRWSVEDVAERAGLGRTSVYRRFGSRDDIVHAVLARELRSVLAAISDAAAAATKAEDKAVAAVTTALAALDGSVVDSLLRSDPATFLPMVTTDAGPLLAIARQAISGPMSTAAGAPPPELAEAVARLGLSFVLTRDTVLPVRDPAALDAAVRRMVRPFFVVARV